MKTRSGGSRCPNCKGMATSSAGTVNDGFPTHLGARALAGYSKSHGKSCVWRAARAFVRTGTTVPLKDTFAAQVLARTVDTEL